MRNHVYFRTSLFENKESKTHFINPRGFGEDMATWLLEKLHGNALTTGHPIQEDYGWGFWIEDSYWVAFAGATNERGTAMTIHLEVRLVGCRISR